MAPTSFEPFPVLDSSKGFAESSPYQRDIASACYRFVDSETQFSEAAINLLLRSVQQNVCEHRVKWFLEVRDCRRRSQKAWDRTPLAKLFTTHDQYQFLHSRAVRFRIRALIKQRGLFVLDAFRAFNVSGTGSLTCTELYSGICWLGLDLSVPQIHDVRSPDALLVSIAKCSSLTRVSRVVSDCSEH